MRSRVEEVFEAIKAFGREELGWRVRTIPSLTAADRWHYQEGFVAARRAAEAYLWHKERCYVGHFSVYARRTAGSRSARPSVK